MEENKLFESGIGKHKYNVKIEVYENCAVTKVENVEEKKMTYYELIGILEAQKHHIMWVQREATLKKKLEPKKKK